MYLYDRHKFWPNIENDRQRLLMQSEDLKAKSALQDFKREFQQTASEIKKN